MPRDWCAGDPLHRCARSWQCTASRHALCRNAARHIAQDCWQPAASRAHRPYRSALLLPPRTQGRRGARSRCRAVQGTASAASQSTRRHDPSDPPPVDGSAHPRPPLLARSGRPYALPTRLAEHADRTRRDDQGAPSRQDGKDYHIQPGPARRAAGSRPDALPRPAQRPASRRQSVEFLRTGTLPQRPPSHTAHYGHKSRSRESRALSPASQSPLARSLPRASNRMIARAAERTERKPFRYFRNWRAIRKRKRALILHKWTGCPSGQSEAIQLHRPTSEIGVGS